MIRGITEDILRKVYNFTEMTDEELRCKFFQKLQECIELCNNSSEILEWIKNEGLEKIVNEILTLWKEDGTIDKIINSDLFDKLKEELTNQIETITIYATPKMFGAIGDGTTNDTSSLQSAIDYCITNSIALKSNKKYNYAISSPIIVNGNLELDFQGASIIALNNMNEMINYNHSGNTLCTIQNIVLNCNTKNTDGLHVVNAQNKQFTNISVRNCLQKAFKQSGGFEVFVDKLSAYAPLNTSNNGYAIYTTAHDNHYTNITSRDLKFGIYSSGSNFFTRCHPWLMSKEVLIGSVGFSLNETSFLTDCYSDTFETAFLINGDKSINMTGCKTFYNKDYYNTDTMPNNKPVCFRWVPEQSSTNGLVMQGCNFRGAVSCYSDGSLGKFTKNKNLKYKTVEKVTITGWDNESYPLEPTTETGAIILSENFIAQYNRLIKIKDSDLVIMEVCVKYNGGTINANTDTVIGSIQAPFQPRTQKVFMCMTSPSSSKWQMDSAEYAFLNNDSLSIKLKEFKINPYFYFNIVYRSY